MSTHTRAHHGSGRERESSPSICRLGIFFSSPAKARLKSILQTDMFAQETRQRLARGNLNSSDHIFVEEVVKITTVKRKGVQDPVLYIVVFGPHGPPAQP